MKPSAANGAAYPYRLSVAITLEQNERIREIARISGLSPGAYARHVLSALPMPIPPPSVIDSEAAKHLQQIRRDLDYIIQVAGLVDPDALVAARLAVLAATALLRRIAGLPELSEWELDQITKTTGPRRPTP